MKHTTFVRIFLNMEFDDALTPVAPKIAVAPVAIPAMIVVETAAIAVPVTFEKLPSLVTGTYPARAAVRRPGPVSVMPPVTIA